MAQTPSIKKSLFHWDYSLSILINFIIYFIAIFVLYSYISEVVRSPFPHIPQALEEKKEWPFRIELIVDRANVDTNVWAKSVSELQRNSKSYRVEFVTRDWRHSSLPTDPAEIDQLLFKYFSISADDKVFSFFLFCGDRKSDWVVGIYRYAWIFENDCSNLKPTYDAALPFIQNLLSPPETYPVKVSPFSTLSYTLLNSHPTSSWRFRWEWSRLYQGYLEYFLKRVQPIFDPIVESQILHYGEIVEGDETQIDGGTCVSPNSLRTFIGKTQWNIVSTSSVDRTVEFMIYIPPEEDVPLTICDHSEDSFAVPRWGTVVLYNPQPSPEAVTLLEPEDLKPTFQKLIFHLRSILGLQGHVLETLHAPGGIADWEVDYLFRAHSTQHLEYIRESLISTQELLDQNLHVPVTDSMAEVLTSSIDLYNRAMKSCELGEYGKCATFAKRSLRMAIKANRHHGMLPMLHFSLKFTYATYSPFFLPTGLLVLYCFLSRLKYTLASDADLVDSWEE